MDDIRPAIVEGNLSLILSHIAAAPDAETRRKRVGMVLTYALTQDHPSVISAMLKEDFDPNQRLRLETMLMVATRFGRTEAVRALLDRGADINASDYTGDNALSKAAEKGDLAIVTLLLDRGADTGPITSEYRSPTSAIRRALDNGRNHFAVVRVLLEHGADANETIYRKPLLSVLAQAGQTEIVRIAIERGADVNAQEERFDETVLRCAAKQGHADIVEMLLKAGADAGHRDSLGRTALSEAAGGNHTEVVRALLEAEPNPSGKERIKERKNALAHAIAVGRTKIVKLLLEHGVNPNVRSDRMPLLASVINNNQEESAFEKTGLLLDFGARVNARDADGWTAWMWANAYGYLSVMELLERRGAKVDFKWPVPLADLTLAVIREAQTVETFRVTTAYEENDRESAKIWGYPVTVTASGPALGADFAAKVEALLKDYRTYMGHGMKCGFEPGVAFRLETVQGRVSVLICFNCLDILITTYRENREIHRRMAHFHPAYQSVVDLAQEAFPDDPDLSLLGANSKITIRSRVEDDEL